MSSRRMFLTTKGIPDTHDPEDPNQAARHRYLCPGAGILSVSLRKPTRRARR